MRAVDRTAVPRSKGVDVPNRLGRIDPRPTPVGTTNPRLSVRGRIILRVNSDRDDRAGVHPRYRLPSLTVLAAIAVVWEAVKALFALPSYQLPHLYEIAADFLRTGAGGERWLWIMAQNAAYTALESLVSASRWVG